MIKLVDKSLMRNGLFAKSQNISLQIINHKGESGKFAGEKSGRHHLHPVTKMNILNNGSNGHVVPPHRTHWEGHSST